MRVQGGSQFREGGLTLVELIVVVSIFVIVLAIAVPNLVATRMRANESAALGHLRSVATAQSQFREGAKADEDFDGKGEFGTFGEMGGRVGVRGLSTKVPTDLTAAMSMVDVAGEVSRSGYIFRLYLPRADGTGQREQPYGGMPAGVVDPDNGERFWVCYAWPTQSSISGSQTFVMNQSGHVRQSTESRRSGQNTAYVRAGDAFVTANPDSMVDEMATGSAGSDGNTWLPLN